MTETKATLFLYDRQMTRFMQSADVFAPTQVVMYPPLTVTFAGEITEQNIKAIVNRLDDGKFGIIALVQVDTVLYQNPDIHSVSNGQKWAPVEAILP